MKKRIRKKLHLKEFAQFGFELHLEFEGADDAAQDAIAQQVLNIVVESGWDCYGALQQLFVYESKPGLNIAAGVEAFLEKVRQVPGITAAHAHEVIDAWHGPAIEMECDCGCGCDHDHNHAEA